jgi:peptidoglycan hydrolase-like protein with peptidoglycan-binding domain
MSWRVAKSLLTLRDQIDDRYPHRSKASDGFIGDEDHQNRNSDHNPWYGPGIVTAGDFTHDVNFGIDIDAFTDELVASRDPRIKYIIANGLILSGANGPFPWVWREYNGPNDHSIHFHLSVVASPLCDDETPWNIPSLGGAPTPTPVKSKSTSLSKGPPWIDGVSTGDRVYLLQVVLNAWYPWLDVDEDGFYGTQTFNAVWEFQTRKNYEDPSFKIDGIAGPQTLGALGIR